MTDKITLLRQICEMPGWQPPEQSSSIERTLQDLLNEGWVLPRLDGWEATGEALECYPNFYVDSDGAVRGERTVAPPERNGSAPADTVERGRLETLVRAMVEVMPIMHVARLLQATSTDLPKDDLGWKIARELTDTLLRTDSRATPSASPTS